MTEESEIQKLKSEYPEFFAQFSPEFLKFIFSEETSLEIASICLENKVEDEETIEKIAYRVTLALLNQVPKENLAKVLEKGTGLNHETAEKISVEIKRRILSQIPEIEKKEEQPTQSAQPFSPVTEEKKSEEPPKKDTYREPVE
jgi:hypothetical protein